MLVHATAMAGKDGGFPKFIVIDGHAPVTMTLRIVRMPGNVVQYRISLLFSLNMDKRYR